MNNLIVNYFYSMKRTAGFIVLLIGGIAAISAFITPAPVTTKAALGKKLFNDKILSKDNTISCASCHLPEYGFSDTVAFSKGIEGRATTRNTPSVLNMKNRPYFFWDGRAASLEQQALMPIAHPDEMGLPIQEAVARLNASSEYRKLFLRIFLKPYQIAKISVLHSLPLNVHWKLIVADSMRIWMT
jgi:cytochrome c peroxidase